MLIDSSEDAVLRLARRFALYNQIREGDPAGGQDSVSSEVVSLLVGCYVGQRRRSTDVLHSGIPFGRKFSGRRPI